VIANLDHLRPRIANLTPLGEAATVKAQAVQTSDSFSMLPISRNYSARLPLIDFIRHPHFSARANLGCARLAARIASLPKRLTKVNIPNLRTGRLARVFA
jgi:hypothetical protein